MAISGTDSIRGRLKELIIEGLNLDGVTPDMIGDDAPIFGGELGLDSVDALELMVMIEQEFGVRIEGRETNPEVFGSISKLSAFVKELQVERDATKGA